MALPSFTAELSLRPAAGRYRAAIGAAAAADGSVIAAPNVIARPIGGGGRGTVGGTLCRVACGAAAAACAAGCTAATTPAGTVFCATICKTLYDECRKGCSEFAAGNVGGVLA
jgi:hypothetical protein